MVAADRDRDKDLDRGQNRKESIREMNARGAPRRATPQDDEAQEQEDRAWQEELADDSATGDFDAADRRATVASTARPYLDTRKAVGDARKTAGKTASKSRAATTPTPAAAPVKNLPGKARAAWKEPVAEEREPEEREPQATYPVRAPLDPSRLKRNRPDAKEQDEPPQPPPVTMGPMGEVVGFLFNPSREKIREVTSVDWMQARLFPQLDMLNAVWSYVIEVATYRQSPVVYRATYKRARPVQPGVIGELLYRIAQWNRSKDGKAMETAGNLALAEIETKSGEDDFGADKGGEYE